MAFTSYLTRRFPLDVRDAGEELFEGGELRIHQAGSTNLLAYCEDGSRAIVQLRRDGGSLHAVCTCAAFSEEGVCEHVWAAILTADSFNYLRGNGTDPVLVIPPLGTTADVPDLEEEDVARPRKSSRPSPSARPKKPTPPAWQRTLAQVRKQMQAPARPSFPLAMESTGGAGSEVIYVVDATQTLQLGKVAVEIYTRENRPGGTGRLKAISLSQGQVQQWHDANDVHILTLLTAQAGASGMGYYYYNVPKRVELSGRLLHTALPLICRTGRALLRPLNGEPDVPLTWDDGPPWELWLQVERVEATRPRSKDGGYELTASFRRGEELRHLSTAHFLMRGGPVVWKDEAGATAARMDDFDAFELVALFRKETKLRVPADQADPLLADLLSLPRVPRIDLPEELRFEDVTLTPRPCVKVRPSPENRFSSSHKVWADLAFEYDGVTVPQGQAGGIIYQPDKRRLIRRDPSREQQAEAELGAQGFRQVNHYAHGRQRELAARALPKVVRNLVATGWRVEAEGKLYRTAGAFHIEVNSGVDWFDLEGSVDFDGRKVFLPTLLAALKKGEDTVLLDDGTYGMLPEDWLKKFGALLGIGKVEGDNLRFQRHQTGLLDALLSAQPEVSYDEVFNRAREELRSFEGIQPAEAPAEFQGELRAYQKDGLGWLHFLQRFGFGGCLADDMGLGKTIQVLALLEERRQLREAQGEDRPPPSLVVVPRSLVFNWMEEAARFTPKLRVANHTTLDRAKDTAAFDQYDVILATYGTLRRDVPFLKDFRFDYCILDESQAIKNAESESAKAARLLQGSHKLAMSGTPVENHLGELWSLFEFLNPGMLGTASVFQLGATKNPDPETRAMLAKGLRPFILRRTKEQVATDLPEKTEQTIYCELDAEQRKRYTEMRDFYRASLLEKAGQQGGVQKIRMQILEALLRLRQVACHPGLVDPKQRSGSSAKLEALLPQIRELLEEDHKILVFSQFTQLLGIVKGQLDREKIAYEYLDGKTRDRQGRVERFQNDPNCKLFLISLKAGGVGLNLTAAEYVFLLDPWWNPAVEAQAIDRAHRIGQNRPVFAYRLIARDTVEEKILQLQQTKRDLADAIINADNSLIGRLGKEDLEMLLS